MAVSQSPRNAEALNYRGIARLQQGNFDGAIEDFSKSLAIRPAYANAHNNRGVAWYQKGDLNRAVADYNQAIAIDPAYASAYTNRGVVWYQLGLFANAMQDYRQALALKPDYSAYHQLAWALVVCPDDHYRDGFQALELAQKAVALKSEAKSLATLAAAYAEAGRFEDAVTTQQRVVALLDPSDQPGLWVEHSERLKVYQAQTTLHQRLQAFRPPLNSGDEPENSPGPDPDRLQETSLATAAADPGPLNPYTVQISAYRQLATSAQVALTFKRKQEPVFNAYAVIPDEKEEWYRVFFGCYETQQAAQEAAEALQKRKFRHTNVLKMPYAIQIGSFDAEAQLTRLEADLQAQDYIAYRLPDRLENGKTRLLVGAFATPAAAERQLEKLQVSGLEPRVVQR